MSVWLCACGMPSVYSCEGDVQCKFDVVQGVCEPSGYCSFPDPGCGSSRRYGTAAPAEFAGACVEPPVATGRPHTAGGDAKGTDTEADVPDTLTTSTDGSSGDLPDASSSTDAVEPDSLDTGGETTGGHACPEQFDHFEGPSLERLWFAYDTGVIVVDGELSLMRNPMEAGFVGVGTLNDLDMHEGSVTVERGQPPLADGYQQVVQLVNDQEAWAAFVVLYDSVQVRASTDDGGFEVVASAPFDGTEDHRWLRVEQKPDTGVLRFSSSHDGVAFDTIGEVEVDTTAWSSLRLDLATTAWLPALLHPAVSFRSFEHCSRG